jgi:hypothetical protein
MSASIILNGKSQFAILYEYLHKIAIHAKNLAHLEHVHAANAF